MKLFNATAFLLAAAAITPVTAVDNPCPFCPGGITLGESEMAAFFNETELADVVTDCESLAESAKALEEDSEECSTMYIPSEESCCPAKVENPCTICAGATIDTSVTFPAMGDMGDCNAMIGIASATMSADNPECPFFQLFEAACCPTPATNPCSICPEGETVSVGAYIMGESGPTCSDVLTNTEEGSPACSAAKDPAEDLISTCCVQAGVTVPNPGDDATLSPVASPPADEAPDDATLLPVASPPADEAPDDATLSPVASPPADGSAASGLLTSNIVMRPMTSLLFVLAWFLLA